MARTSLVPFDKVKEIINSLDKSEIVQYDGAFCTQTSTIGSSNDEISVVEVKIAFIKKETDKDGEGQSSPA